MREELNLSQGQHTGEKPWEEGGTKAGTVCFLVCALEWWADHALVWGLQSSSSHARPSLAGVECIFFNEEYLICDWASKGKPTANYSFYYW